MTALRTTLHRRLVGTATSVSAALLLGSVLVGTSALAVVPSSTLTTTTVISTSTTVTPAPPSTAWSATELPQPIPLPLDEDVDEPVVPLGSIAIPAIDIDRQLYEGIRLPTFNLGPGHWPGSALPGQPGNMVIGGHRTSHNHDFRNLDQLVPGDQVIVTDTAGSVFTYAVVSTEITGPFSTRLTYQTPLTTGTLFACNPPGQTTQRIVVHLALA